jgi:apolipoprotein N-acyltransferase
VLNLLLALASAGLLILIYPRFELVWLAPAALTPLLVAVAREPRAARRFLLGWAAGVAYWFGVCNWIQFTLAVHGGMGEIEAWALFCLFAAAKALHMGVFAWLAGFPLRRWWAVPGVAALWVAVEATHGSLGFAWLALGNAGIDMQVPMRLAPITGVYGLSFVFAATAAVLALTLLRRPRVQVAWLLALPLLFLLPRLPAAAPGHETALLAQPAISETEQWTMESVDAMQQEQVTLTLNAALRNLDRPPSIVAWPEVPAPLYYDEDQRLQSRVNDLARTLHAYLLIGSVAHNPAGEPLNSAVLISPEGGMIDRYDKVNLVPFGEYVPWPFGYLVDKVSTEAGDFAAGDRVVVSPVGGGHLIGAFICYESVFPGFVRKFAAGGAQVLFNISNDGWFGQSAARRQHLSIVRMRAAENRRWILRSTNDGITAAIDAAGRVRATLPLSTEATLETSFDYISQETLYTRWGDWFPWLCASLALRCQVAERAL